MAFVGQLIFQTINREQGGQCSRHINLIFPYFKLPLSPLSFNILSICQHPLYVLDSGNLELSKLDRSILSTYLQCHDVCCVGLPSLLVCRSVDYFLFPFPLANIENNFNYIIIRTFRSLQLFYLTFRNKCLNQLKHCCPSFEFS